MFALNFTETRQGAQVKYTSSEHPAGHVLNGTLALDMACQEEANLAGLAGTYVALVSASSRSLKQLLLYQHKDSMPVINTKVNSSLFVVCSLFGCRIT